MANRSLPVAPAMPSSHRKALGGFTLVELLVVIGIIAVLISILLPALGKARRQAETVACAAKIRSILQAMQMYASENKNYFPGGAATTGRHLFTATWTNNSAYSDDNCPEICQVWDWMSPLARFMQVPFETGGTRAQRLQRFDALRTHPAFTCPSNQILAGAYDSSSVRETSVNLVVSYNTASQFHLMPWGPKGRVGVTHGSAGLSSPAGYVPKLNKVGGMSDKIFIADGARFSNTNTAPDIDLGFTGPGGGAFSDMGAFTPASNSWNRSCAPGNGGTGIDARIYAFRHGRLEQRGPADAYRFNVGFFDGHVQTMGDLEAANPNYWMPRGSTYDPNGNFGMYEDAASRYGADVANGIQ